MSHTKQNIWLTARRLIFQFPNQWMSVAVLPSVISDCHADTFLHAESNSKARSLKNLSFQIRGAKKIEKQDGTEPVFAARTIVNKISLKKSHQSKSVIEKFNKAYDLCRDISQFYLLAAKMNFRKKCQS